jgi:hypothetical protein
MQYAITKLAIPPAEAEKKVHEMNKQREQYVQRNWGRKWMSPLNYHLCVDTSFFGVEGSAELIARAATERLKR